MKTVLITGCSSGYGLETARYFLSQGWNVVATMRTPRDGVLPRSERLRVLALDVTNPESIAAALDASGPIDVLVNNAASGMTPAQIASAARNVKVLSLIDLTLSSNGLMRGNNLANWIDTMTAGVPMEDFPVRFAAVATDLQSSKPVLLDRGSAGNAIQASAAVPGMNVPVPYKDGHLIDGGITSLVPVRFARAMGADFVMAVDIYCQGRGSDGLGVPTVIQRVMHTQSCLVAAPEMAEADVLIAPAVSVPRMSDKDQQERTIQAGYEAARAALARIMVHRLTS